MKCPFRTTTIHKLENTSKNVVEDIVEFGECYKTSCPYYYTTWAHRDVEHCRKVESEEKG